MTLDEAYEILGITDKQVSQEELGRHYMERSSIIPEATYEGVGTYYTTKEKADLDEAFDKVLADRMLANWWTDDNLKFTNPMTPEEQARFRELQRFYSKENGEIREKIWREQIDNFTRIYEEDQRKKEEERELYRSIQLEKEAKKKAEQERLRREEEKRRAEQARILAEREAEEEKKKRKINKVKKVFVLWIVFMILYILSNG